MHPSALVAWDTHCQLAMAALVSCHAAVPALHRLITCASSPVRLLSALLLAPRLWWSLCLAPSLPLIGVTSMSFRLGCHRPFHRSYCLRSLLLLSQDCVLSLFGSVSFASAIPDIMLQHVPTSTVVTLRPFTPCFNCWCLQRQSIVTPRCRWWFRGTHPSWCFCGR